jgi:hypothetical protein
MTDNNFSDIFGTEKIVVEPTADQRDGAIQMYQLRQAWIDAGFTPAEAMQLLISAITKG